MPQALREFRSAVIGAYPPTNSRGRRLPEWALALKFVTVRLRHLARNPVGRVLGNGRFCNRAEGALPAGGFPLLAFAEVASTSAPNFVGPTAGHATSARQAWPSCSRRRAERDGVPRQSSRPLFILR
jgi:hypothetical protein